MRAYAPHAAFGRRSGRSAQPHIRAARIWQVHGLPRRRRRVRPSSYWDRGLPARGVGANCTMPPRWRRSRLEHFFGFTSNVTNLASIVTDRWPGTAGVPPALLLLIAPCGQDGRGPDRVLRRLRCPQARLEMGGLARPVAAPVRYGCGLIGAAHADRPRGNIPDGAAIPIVAILTPLLSALATVESALATPGAGGIAIDEDLFQIVDHVIDGAIGGVCSSIARVRARKYSIAASRVTSPE